jgi:tetratricopeptide (TPR) repeat protein
MKSKSITKKHRSQRDATPNPMTPTTTIESTIEALPERRELQKKREREVVVISKAMLLNQSGISKLQSGQDDEAEVCFQQALLASSVKATFPKWAKLSKAELGRIACHSDANTTDGQLNESSTSAAPRCTYNRQVEFDEGMYVYSDALPIKDDLTEKLQAATLHYNVAQTHVRRGKYSHAKQWLELAVVQLLLDPQNEQAANIAFRVRHNLGHCLYRLGQSKESMCSYQKALQLANEINLPPEHAAATYNCTAVLIFHDNPFESSATAMSLFQKSLAVYEDVYGKESKEVATVLNNIGRLHYRNADFEQALTVYTRALAIRRQQFGCDSIDVAATVCNVAQTYHQCAKFEQAVAHYLEFLDVAESRLGSNHRDIAVIFKCIAEIRHEQLDFSNAKIWYTKALSATRNTLGNCHPGVASVLNKLGNLHFELDELDESLDCYTKGLRIEQAALSWNHPHIIVALMNIAQIHRKRGHYADALITYSQIIIMQVETYGQNSLEVASTLSSMGQLQYQQKNHAMAFELYQRALQIQRDHYVDNENAGIACTLSSIGLVLFNLGEYDLAKSCFSDSLRIRTTLLGPDHRDIANLWYNLATIYLEAGDDDTAILMYKETLRIERHALGDNHHDVISILQHIAIVYQRRGELDLALKFFSEALRCERAKDDKNHTSIAKLLNLIGNIHLQTGKVGPMVECYSEASRIFTELGEPGEIVGIAGFNFYFLSKLHPPCAPVA